MKRRRSIPRPVIRHGNGLAPPADGSRGPASGDAGPGAAARRSPGSLLRATAFAAGLATLVPLLGCAPRSLVERAIEARGGPLTGWVRDSEVRVAVGFPGAWSWRTAFLAPDRFAWEIDTAAGEDRYLFDGRAVRSYSGDRLVSVDAARSGPLPDQATLAAVANLDGLRGDGVVVEPLAAAELPPGVESGLAVHLPGGAARYRVGFDRDLLVVWVSGPAEVPPMGAGELSLRWSDHRAVGGRRLPFATTYLLGDVLLAEERARSLCPAPPGLEARSFTEPGALPACPRSELPR